MTCLSHSSNTSLMHTKYNAWYIWVWIHLFTFVLSIYIYFLIYLGVNPPFYFCSLSIYIFPDIFGCEPTFLLLFSLSIYISWYIWVWTHLFTFVLYSIFSLCSLSLSSLAFIVFIVNYGFDFLSENALQKHIYVECFRVCFTQLLYLPSGQYNDLKFLTSFVPLISL